MAILRARDKDGNIIDIPAIKGDPGKSAYEYAKEGGYTGTESDFNNALANIGTGSGADPSIVEAHAVVVDEKDTRLDAKLIELEAKISSGSQSSDLILTDTETGTKYKLTIIGGKLTLIEQEE